MFWLQRSRILVEDIVLIEKGNTQWCDIFPP